MEQSLTLDKRDDLEKMERIIERGQKTFVEVGQALALIRDGRLYRASHDTFETYLADRWPEISRPQAYRMIGASEVVANLSPIGDKIPSEGSIRSIVNLPPEEQRAVYQAATNAANGAMPTGKQVSEAKALLTHPPAPPDFANWQERAMRVNMILAYVDGQFSIFIDGLQSYSSQRSIVKQLIEQYEADAKLFQIHKTVTGRWEAIMHENGMRTDPAYSADQARGLGRAMWHRINVAKLNAQAPEPKAGHSVSLHSEIMDCRAKIAKADDHGELGYLCNQMLMLLDAVKVLRDQARGREA